MARRDRPRSSNGTSRGPATAMGAMVSPRYRATFSRACPTGREKKTELASATATMASPATLAMCTREYRSRGSPERYMRWSGRVARSTRRPSHSRTSAARSRARWPAEGRACGAGGGVGSGADGRDARPGGLLTAGALRAGEAFAQEVPGHLRVGRAPGLLHQLAHQELEGALLAALELHHRLGVLCQDLLHQRAQRGGVRDLPEALLRDDVLHLAPGGERVLQGHLGAGRGDGSRFHQPDHVPEMLRGDLAL